MFIDANATVTINGGADVVRPVGTISTTSTAYRVGEAGVTAIEAHHDGYAIVKGADVACYLEKSEITGVYRYLPRSDDLPNG